MLSEWPITLWHVERSDLRSLDKDGEESEGVAVYLSVIGRGPNDCVGLGKSIMLVLGCVTACGRCRMVPRRILVS